MTRRISLATGLGFALTLVLLQAPASARPTKAEKEEARELYRRGVEAGNAGNLDGAIEAFQQATVKDPELALAYLKLGLAYHKADRWPEALAAYDSALGMAKKRKPEAYDYAGRLLRDMGLFEMALESHQNALESARKLRRDYPRAHYEMALDFTEMELRTDALRELRAALEADAEKIGESVHKKARVRLANLLVETDQLDEAETIYRAILEAEPENDTALFNLGILEKKRGNREAARELFQKACELGNRKACEAARTRYRRLR